LRGEGTRVTFTKIPTMIVLISIGLLLAGALLNFILRLKAPTVEMLARVYFVLICLVAAFTWIFYLAGIKNTTVLNVLQFGMRYMGRTGSLLLGYLFAYLAAGPRWPEGPDRRRVIQQTTIWALSIMEGNAFILATVGKAMNMTEIMTFFQQSGYAMWFLYFIMTAEAAGALGILLHFKLRTGLPATVGLMLIMLGAVYTHWHNKDPFSDSLAAVSQFVNLTMLLLLYLLQRKGRVVAASGDQLTMAG
jgi:DoxX-like family